MNFKTEFLCVLLLILGLTLSAFIVISRFPIVWGDEVMFADPGINLYWGNGFTSSAWFAQTSDEFWAGNAPLYSFLLSLWMRFLGFNLISVRSLSYGLMVIATLTLWLSTYRLNLISTTWSRLLCIIIVLSGYGIGFSYRTGRYDALSIALCAMLILAHSIANKRLGYFVLGVVAFFFPLAGLQLLPYFVTMYFLVILFLGKSYLKTGAAIMIGLLLGSACLGGIYFFNDALEGFSRTSDALRNSNLPGSFPKDPSLFLVLLAALAVLVQQVFSGRFILRSLLTFSLVAFFVIPGVFFFLGRFPTYYSWMIYIPLAIALCASIDKTQFNLRNPIRLLVALTVGLGCLVGTPLQTFSALYFWQYRDYSNVEAFVARNVQDNDWVYAASSTYYAVKPKAEFSAFDSYIDVIPPEESEKISLIIVNPSINRVDTVMDVLGGNWTDVIDEIHIDRKFLFFKKGFGDKLSENYHLQVFRRLS